MGVFDVFKDKDEDSDDGGTTEEYRSEDTSSGYTSEPEPAEEEALLNPVTRLPLLSSLLKKQPHIHKLKLRNKVRLE